MGRPTKEGLDYFPLDTDFFENENVIVLIDKFGSDGVSLFIYILCKCYRKKGYYLIYDDKFKHIAARNLKISANRISLIIAFLSDCSMLRVAKGTTADGDTAFITSDGIQMQYQQTMKRLNRDVTVDRRIWTLDEENTEGFIKFAHDRVNRTETEVNRTETRVNRKKSAQRKGKVKEKKVKEREIKVCADAHHAPDQTEPNKHFFGTNNQVALTDKEYNALIDMYPKDHERMINNLDHYLYNHPEKHYRSHFGTMMKWEEEDRQKNLRSIMDTSHSSNFNQAECDAMIANDEAWIRKQAELYDDNRDENELSL